jgi:uncharacterized membrane protein (UPF0136 family)
MKTLSIKMKLLDMIEFVSALVFITAGKLLEQLSGKGISTFVMGIILLIFTILLIIYSREQIFCSNKPLLTVLSIFYKTVAYVAIIFIMGNYAGKNPITVFAIFLFLLYSIFSYIYGKHYYQMLNAYEDSF